MTVHLTALAAVTDLLQSQPLPRGAALSVELNRYDHTDDLGATVQMHQTPRRITEAVVSTLGLVQGRSYLTRRDGTVYRTIRYSSGMVDANYYGPDLTPQARRTACRGDVLRATR